MKKIAYTIMAVAILLGLAYPWLVGKGDGRKNYIWMTQSLFLDKSQGSKSLKELLTSAVSNNRPNFRDFRVQALDVTVFQDGGPVYISSQRVEGGFPIYPNEPLSISFPGGMPEPNNGAVSTDDIYLYCDSPCHFAVLVR
jgi:hypothetical protein